MKPEDIKRLCYYERQFLGVRDFQDEQAYHIMMRRRHLIAQHTWGIVVGLELTQEAGTDGWIMQAGMAVDGFGREIVVFEPEPLNIAQIAAQLSGSVGSTSLRIWLTHWLEKVDRPPAGYELCDQPNQFSRVRETYRILYQDDPPSRDRTNPPQPHEILEDDPTQGAWPIFLGEIVWDSTAGEITAVNLAGRKYVGLVGSEVISPTEPPVLNIRADRTKLDGDLLMPGTVGDGNGRLRLDVDGADESVITNKKAPTPASPNPPSSNIYLRTDRENGGNQIVVDRDTLVAQSAEVEQSLSVGQGMTVGQDLTVVGNMTVQGDAEVVGELIFNAENPQNLKVEQDLTVGGKLTVEGDAEVVGELTFSGNLNPEGTVNGRDIADDGAKLDGISEQAKNVAVVTGRMFDGGTIPLPTGFSQEQCKWIVSPHLFDPPLFDIDENGPDAQFRVECFTLPDRTVVARWWQRGHGSTPGFQNHRGWANYMIVGVK
jgi:hypothetical protein